MSDTQYHFEFESGSVKLDSGELFTPSKHAEAQWVLAIESSYRMSGTSYQVLYQTADQRFILAKVHIGPERPRRFHKETFENAAIISHTEAREWLLNEKFELPDFLTEQEKSFPIIAQGFSKSNAKSGSVPDLNLHIKAPESYREHIQKVITRVPDVWGLLAFDEFPSPEQDIIWDLVYCGIIELRIYQRFHLPGSDFFIDTRIEGTGNEIHDGIEPTSAMRKLWEPTIAAHYADVGDQWRNEIDPFIDESKPAHWRKTGYAIKYQEALVQATAEDASALLKEIVDLAKQGGNIGVVVLGTTPLDRTNQNVLKTVSPNSSVLSSTSRAEESTSTKSSKRRGRKSNTDQVKKDKRIAEAYESGDYNRNADCDRALGLPEGTTYAARERHRKRVFRQK